MRAVRAVTDECKLYGTEQLFLLPEEIVVDERYNVRTFGDGEDGYRIDELAATIERDGQLDAGIVKLKPDQNCYVLIVGHRRRRAICLINQKRTSCGQPLMRMRVIVDSNGDPLRKAIVSNLHRQDFSPMDVANLIQRLRKDHGWANLRGTKNIADYMGVSVQYVNQHERFLGADKGLQNKLHNGVLTWQSAIELLCPGKVPSGQIEAVIDRAIDIQAEVESQRPAEKRKGRIEHPSVKKAIREANGKIARSRKEIIEWFEQLTGPGNEPNVQAFASYFIDQWCPGKGSDRTLLAKFQLIAH